MNFSHFVAKRYMVANREDRFFSWITSLSVVGIAIGVAALIVVISVINGFETELRKRFLMANAHIMAYRYPAGMENPDKWAAKIKSDFPGVVKAISPFVHQETMIKKGAIMEGVLVRGMSPRAREKVQSIREVVNPPTALDALQKETDDAAAGRPAPEVPSIIVGSGVLGIINAKIGDTVGLVASSQEKLTRISPFKIVGTYNSGLKHYDNRLIVMTIPTAQRLFRMGDVVTGLEIALFNDDDSVRISQEMSDKYQLSFREWKSFNRPLFESMKKERILIIMIVAMVVLVAGFNILTTTFVSVTQKQKDVSILRALGAQKRQVVMIFLNQGLYMGIIGSGLGVVLALAISELLERYQFIDLPDPYFLKNLPVTYDPMVYALVSLSSVAVCVIAGLLPAREAAKVTPTDGFRGLTQVP